MNCQEANQIDMCEYLNYSGYQAQKISGNDYWYLSPFRAEKHPSFKINKNKNAWYDHGNGKGGMLVDFVAELYQCNVSEALQKISSFHLQNSFQNNPVRPPLLSYENPLFNDRNATETAIKIIAANHAIQDLWLCRYLLKRGIEKTIADKFCYEISFKNINADSNKIYKAIGFKNNAGGYELRNEYFKGSSTPKFITYINNKTNNITVFEGFFDFLTYQSIHQNQQHELTSFLVLNSLSFFEKCLLLMEKHKHIHLYLDHDDAGKKCSELALKRSIQFTDESKLYKGYKDLNEWKMNFGKLQKTQQIQYRNGGRL
jgi:DNA primase